MKIVSGKDFARLLEKHGLKLKRVTGSHHVYAKAGNPARISVPVHGNASLKIGLLEVRCLACVIVFSPNYAIHTLTREQGAAVK